MTIENANFEKGWTRKTHTGQEFGEIFVPEGWTAFWREGGEAPHDPGNTNGYGRPEMHVINKEPPYLSPPRIYEGNKALKLFTFYRIHDAGYYQRIAVEKGAVCNLSVYAHAWSSTNDDPHTSDIEGDAAYNMAFMVGIDPYGKTDPWDAGIIWSEPNYIYDQYRETEQVIATAKADHITVFIRSTVRYPFKHCDAYFDNVLLSVQDNVPPDPPSNTIPPGGYDRTYLVVPSDIPIQRRVEIYSQAARDQVTVGPSADDSRAWATELIDTGNEVKAVVFDRKEEDKDEWEDYYMTREPRMVIEFKGDTLPPDPPDPPDPGNPPPPIIHYSRNFVGLHHCFLKEDWDKYIREAHPTVTKCFTCGDTIATKKQEPRMLSVWRKHVNNDGSWLIGDRSANALKFLDLISNELQVHCWNAGISEEEALKDISIVESINETVPSNNVPHIESAVEFDCYFSEHLHARYGNLLHAGLLTVAVGNPLEDEVYLLLPIAKKSHELGDFISYHSYWAADNVRSYIDEGWQWHAGRWQEWDKEFTAHGYFPRYYSGECGICYTYPESNGQTFVATRGWRSCGSFPNYIWQIERYNALLTAWNAEHQGRCFGGTLYAYGIWNWPDFEFNPGDLALLTDAMKKYA